MDEINYTEYVRETILKNKRPSYQTTNRKEVRVRCPYCGDSKTNKSSAHLYIEMKPPFRFHCFKCETSGVLNQDVLRDLDLNMNELRSTIVSANKNVKLTNTIGKISFKKKKLQNTPVDTEISARAVQYFNNRYGSSYTNEYIVNKFKTVTDPIHFFEENKISIPNGQYDFANAIGFISSDNSHIIFRDISGRQPKRYFNLNLYQDEDVTSKSYNISNNIDIMEERVSLVITEGIFDIIGVYSHFYNENSENTIFAAACGKAYNAIILKYIRMGFLDLDITIYSDADVDVSFYRNLKESSPYLKNIRLTIYYNSLYDPETGYGKDYGVPKHQIKLRKVIV